MQILFGAEIFLVQRFLLKFDLSMEAKAQIANHRKTAIRLLGGDCELISRNDKTINLNELHWPAAAQQYSDLISGANICKIIFLEKLIPYF